MGRDFLEGPEPINARELDIVLLLSLKYCRSKHGV